MEETTTPITEPRSSKDLPLQRPLAGRMVAGVAAGLGAKLGVPAWVIRVIFIIISIGGGLGIALYVAGWLLIPGEGDDRIAAQRLLEKIKGGQSWLGVLLVFIAVVLLAERFDFLSSATVWGVALLVLGILLYRGDLAHLTMTSRKKQTNNQSLPGDSNMSSGTTDTLDLGAPPDMAPPPPALPPVPSASLPPPPPPAPPKPRSILGRLTIAATLLTMGGMALADNWSSAYHPQPRHYLAAAVGVIGGGLLVGTFYGRARWLILPAAVLIPPLLAAPAIELVEFREVDSQRFLEPTSLSELPPAIESIDGLHIDLRSVPWNGETASLRTEVAFGDMTVLLPDGVGAEVTAEIGAGALRVGDQSASGAGIDETMSLPGTNGTLRLTTEVGFGAVTVRNEDPERDFEHIFPAGNRKFVPTVDLTRQGRMYRLAKGSLTADLSSLPGAFEGTLNFLIENGNLEIRVPRGAGVQLRGVWSAADFFGDQRPVDEFDGNLLARPGDPNYFIDVQVPNGTVSVIEIGES